jgi:hypothetical protein
MLDGLNESFPQNPNRRMTDKTIPRITFDTNVCNVINNPEKWPTLVAPDDARKIRVAISDGRIAGFVSEATLFVECLSFPDKLTYLSVAGTPDPRPTPDPRLIAVFDDPGRFTRWGGPCRHHVATEYGESQGAAAYRTFRTFPASPAVSLRRPNGHGRGSLECSASGGREHAAHPVSLP